MELTPTGALAAIYRYMIRYSQNYNTNYKKIYPICLLLMKEIIPIREGYVSFELIEDYPICKKLGISTIYLIDMHDVILNNVYLYWHVDIDKLLKTITAYQYIPIVLSDLCKEIIKQDEECFRLKSESNNNKRLDTLKKEYRAKIEKIKQDKARYDKILTIL